MQFEFGSSSNFIAERDVSVLWDEFQLGKLLDGELPTGDVIAKEDISPNKSDNKVDQKHKKMLAKPSYAVLMNRYQSRPHEPKFIQKGSLDRLADPLRGRYADYDQYVNEKHADGFHGPESSPSALQGKISPSKHHAFTAKPAAKVESSFFLTGANDDDDAEYEHFTTGISKPDARNAKLNAALDPLMSKLRRKLTDATKFGSKSAKNEAPNKSKNVRVKGQRIRGKQSERESSSERKAGWNDKLFLPNEKGSKFASRKSKAANGESQPLNTKLKTQKAVKSSGYGKLSSKSNIPPGKPGQSRAPLNSLSDPTETVVKKIQESVLNRKRELDRATSFVEAQRNTRCGKSNIRKEDQGSIRQKGKFAGDSNIGDVDRIDDSVVRGDGSRSMLRSKSTTNLQKPQLHKLGPLHDVASSRRNFAEERASARGVGSSGASSSDFAGSKIQRSTRSAPSLLAGLERIPEVVRAGKLSTLDASATGKNGNSMAKAPNSTTRSSMRNKLAAIKASSNCDDTNAGFEPTAHFEKASRLKAGGEISRSTRYAWAEPLTTSPQKTAAREELTGDFEACGFPGGDVHEVEEIRFQGPVSRRPTSEVIEVLQRAQAGVVVGPKGTAEDNAVAKLMQYAKKIEGHFSTAQSLSSQYRDLTKYNCD